VKKAGSTKTSSRSKVARGLDVRKIISPEDAAEALDAKVDSDATVLDLVHAAIGASVQRLLANDPVIRIGEDPEGVHQARVATRRLRSDLRTFGPVLDEGWSDDLRAELRWLGAALGNVRDADVLTELLRSASTALPDGQQPSAEPLFSRLADQRVHEREALLALMRSDRYVTLLERLVDAARDPKLAPEKGSRRARKLAPGLGQNAWRQLCKAIRNLDGDPADADLHRVRRRAKQARYALEAISAVAGKREANRAEIAAGIQGTLGDHQDRVVACQWLIDAADAIGQSQSAFVAGELSARLRDEQRALRKRARKECREACRS
jgi:CHAD domain-containing protein